MTLTIPADLIISDRTTHAARPVVGHRHAWQLAWLPGQTTHSSDCEVTRR